MTTPKEILRESRERLTGLDGQGRNVERVQNVFAQVLWDLVEVAAAQQEAITVLVAQVENLQVWVYERSAEDE